jgi:hypothetical protein
MARHNTVKHCRSTLAARKPVTTDARLWHPWLRIKNATGGHQMMQHARRASLAVVLLLLVSAGTAAGSAQGDGAGEGGSGDGGAGDGDSGDAGDSGGPGPFRRLGCRIQLSIDTFLYLAKHLAVVSVDQRFEWRFDVAAHCDTPTT